MNTAVCRNQQVQVHLLRSCLFRFLKWAASLLCLFWESLGLHISSCLTTVLGVHLSRYPFDVLLAVKCMLGTFDVSSGTAPRNDQVCLLLITAMDICVLQTGLPVDNALASAN